MRPCVYGLRFAFSGLVLLCSLSYVTPSAPCLCASDVLIGGNLALVYGYVDVDKGCALSPRFGARVFTAVCDPVSVETDSCRQGESPAVFFFLGPVHRFRAVVMSTGTWPPELGAQVHLAGETPLR